MINNKQGFTLMELMVSMAVAGVILAVGVTIFNDGMKIRDQQVDQNNMYSNLKVASSYLQDDIAQAGSFMGDQGYFKYYNSSDPSDPKKQFCVDFDSNLWPDWASLKAAWESTYTGWIIDNTNEDMIEIWYGDGNVYSNVNDDTTGVLSTIMDFEIQDDPVTLGFTIGDYILFFNTSAFTTVSDANAGGNKSSSSWVTVLVNPVSYTGNNVEGQMILQGAPPFTDPYQSPMGTSMGSQFGDDDMVYKLHRVVYGVVSKTITQNGVTKTIKMLIRDNFSDPTGTSRYNPSIIATNIEQFKLSTIFKLDATEVGGYDDNYFNSVSQSYYSNSPGKMFALPLSDVLDNTKGTFDSTNDNEQDRDPRDLRKIQVELLSISSKIYLQEKRIYTTSGGILPSIFSTPAMGVIAYSDGTKTDPRVPRATAPDWFKHVKLTTEIGLRALRLKDSAVSAE